MIYDTIFITIYMVNQIFLVLELNFIQVFR